uniref:Uncharacterized protein n=1 Tax=viral metagenome TaxID=1070528 RepID=A0A6M3L7S6_9ZZZZ
MEGYITLKEAAARIGRSAARVRQYVHAGKIEWMRNEMGNIMVSEASLEQFTPPARGNARASGVSIGTQLRHARATRKLVQSMIAEGPAKAASLQVLNALVQNLADQASEEGEEADEDSDDIADLVAPPSTAIKAPAGQVAPPVAPEDDDDADMESLLKRL